MSRAIKNDPPEMREEEIGKDRLTNELVELRQRVASLEALVADRNKMGKQLKALRTRYNALVENSPDIIYVLDSEGYFIFVGGAFESLLGYTSEELIGKHFTSIIQSEDIEKAEWRVNERRTGRRCTKGLELRLVIKEGKGRHFNMNHLPIELHAIGVYDKTASEKGSKFLGTFGLARDITRRMMAEEALKKTGRELQDARHMLAQAEKLAAIGRLTAGVAHEILNPVNILSMRLQLLVRTEELSDRARQVIGVCHDQLNRIMEITKDLGQFSGMRQKNITMNDLNKVIEDVLTLCGPQFKEEGIQTDVQYHPELPEIPFDKDRIEQVILNIVSNATEAMGGRQTKILGIITNPSNSGDYLQVIVSDTGPGISHGDMSKIFEPFYTTKEPSRGTGMGLYVCYGIINEHRGRIWAENDERGGASFIIELPVAGNTTS